MTARNGGADSVKWQQEMERNYRVAGGSAVFPFLTRTTAILEKPLTVAEYKKDYWLGAGLDYGIRDMSYMVVWAIGRDMIPHAIWEYGATGDKAFYKKFVADLARKCPYWSEIQGKIAADNTMFNVNQQRSTQMRSIASLIEDEMKNWGGGTLIKAAKGVPSADVRIANMFLGDYWADPMNPKAFITTNCTLLWESAENLRWEEHATSRTREGSAPPLRIKHKHSDPWDASSYFFDTLRPSFHNDKQKMRKGTVAYVKHQIARKERRDKMLRRNA
jgi:hypothetical protein